MTEAYDDWLRAMIDQVKQDAYNRGFADGQLARITKHKLAAALGSIGGRKGGPARAAALSPERRREIARKAALTRWGYQ